jgi:hypothetical protein
MMRYLLGLASFLVMSGLARADVVAFFNTSTTGQSVTTSTGPWPTITFSFSVNGSQPSITGFKLFANSANAPQVTATFASDVGTGISKNITSSTWANGGYFFDLTGSWTGGSLQNIGTGNYYLDIQNFTPSSGSFNYDTTTSNAISTNSGYGITGGNYINATPYARFEVYTVPEPGTLLLGGIAAACGGTGVWWKRRKRQPQPETTEQPAAI